jgi:hypothetical protein
MPVYEVLLSIQGSGSIEVTAESAEKAREIAEGLSTEVDIVFPPESVDDSGFDRMGDVAVDGVTEIQEAAPDPDPPEGVNAK